MIINEIFERPLHVAKRIAKTEGHAYLVRASLERLEDVGLSESPDLESVLRGQVAEVGTSLEQSGGVLNVDAVIVDLMAQIAHFEERAVAAQLADDVGLNASGVARLQILLAEIAHVDLGIVKASKVGKQGDERSSNIY